MLPVAAHAMKRHQWCQAFGIWRAHRNSATPAHH